MSQLSLRNLSRSTAAVRTATPAVENLESRGLFSGTLPAATDPGTLDGQVQTTESASSTPDINVSSPVGGETLTSARSVSRTNYNEALGDATKRMVGSLIGNPGFAKSLAR